MADGYHEAAGTRASWESALHSPEPRANIARRSILRSACADAKAKAGDGCEQLLLCDEERRAALRSMFGASWGGERAQPLTAPRRGGDTRANRHPRSCSL
jgi:hypothetical protein